jgi:hypothetical protein
VTHCHNMAIKPDHSCNHKLILWPGSPVKDERGLNANAFSRILTSGGDLTLLTGKVFLGMVAGSDQITVSSAADRW